MAAVEARIDQAAASHRQAVAIAAAVGAVLDGLVPAARLATTERSIRELAERLRVAAALLAPGWLGAPLDAVPASSPLGVATRPETVRVGTAYPLDDASFPVVVPLGHLAFDADARDPRVAGALRAVLLRLLATGRPGSVLVRAVDPAGVAFPSFAPLHDAGIMLPPVTDRAGLCAVLTEAEEWVRAAEAAAAATQARAAATGDRLPPAPATGDQRPPAGPQPARPTAALAAEQTRTLLLIVASWPQATEPVELARLSALAAAGPAAGVHLVLAGWPPLLLGEDSTEPVALPAAGGAAPAGVAPGRLGPPLPHATRVTMRNPYALVGHPPGGSFGATVPADQPPSTGLNARVFLDESPSVDLVTRVCRDLVTSATTRARTNLGALLSEGPLWAGDATAGLEAPLGRAGETPAALWLTNLSPHWLIGGGAGSGKTALLLDILYGLCGKYGPDQLRCYLLDFSGKASFGGFVPQADDASYLPHARAVGVEPNPADGVAVLHGLAAELAARRAAPGAAPGAGRPRILGMIDEVGELLAGPDPLAGEAAALLESLAEHGGGCGIHLILAGRSRPPEAVAKRCRIRIALPGGAGVLDPANAAAADLSVGAAVVNTASGLGGPVGATRAHEQLIRFPNPYTDPVALAGLRYRWWQAAGGSGA